MEIKEKLKKLSEYNFSDLFFKEVVVRSLTTEGDEDFNYLITALDRVDKGCLYVGYLRNDLVFVIKTDDDLSFMLNSQASCRQITEVTQDRSTSGCILTCEVFSRGLRGVEIEVHLITTDPVIDIPTLWDELGISHRTNRYSRKYEGGRRGI